MSDLVVAPPQTAIPSPTEWQGMREVAATLAESGLFKDARQFGTAIAKVTFGRDLGLGATQAMTGIHIVEGKPELSANLQAALLRQYRSPEGWRYDYRADVSSQGCTIDLFRVHPDGTREEIGRTSFTMEDAQRAGLAQRKGPWQSYPANMMFARALSNAVAWHAPEVTYGTRVYTEGEIGGPVSAPPADPPRVEAPPRDDRPVVQSLRDTVRATGLDVADFLESYSVPPAPSLAERIAGIDDALIGQIIADMNEEWAATQHAIDNPTDGEL